MNGDELGIERSPFEVAMFVIGALGFFIGAAGLVVSSIGAGVFGAFLLLISVSYFVLR